MLVLEQRVELVAHELVQLAGPLAQLAQRAAGGVGDSAGGLERRLESLGEAGQLGEPFGAPGEVGGARGAVFEVAAKARDPAGEGRDLEQG